MSRWDPIRKAMPRAIIEEDGFFSRDLPDCDAEERQAYYEDVRDQLAELGWFLDDLYMDNDTIQGMLRQIDYCQGCEEPRIDEAPEMPVCSTCWDEQMRKP